MDDSAEPVKPDHITREEFLQWRLPRRGIINPQRMTNAVWEYLVKSRLSAYTANALFDGPASFDAGPCWCFDRFGQSETLLPGGTTVLIGGEHEDFYDPDFYIYNDVVLIDKNGGIEILGYPADVFPPTDFHSATLAGSETGSEIFMIGSLGYPQDRKRQHTPVFVLEQGTWKIHPVAASGNPPGWIHHHQAALSSDGREIIITKGLVDSAAHPAGLIENIDDWSLDISSRQWKRLTRRQWARFEIYRKNKKQIHLSDLESFFCDKKLQQYAEAHPCSTIKAEIEKIWKKSGKNLKQTETNLKKELGSIPDPKLLETLYIPDIADETIAGDDDEFRVHRIRVNGVIVRYAEDFGSIQFTVEGGLPDNIVEHLKQDIVTKLSAIEGTPVVCHAIVSD